MVIKTIVVNGCAFQAERVEVVRSEEPWAEMLLADGTVIRTRNVITSVWKYTDQMGQTQYCWFAQQVFEVQSPTGTSENR